MKYTLLSLLLLLMAGGSVQAQTTSQGSKIGFSVWTETQPEELDEANFQLLNNKINQIITRNSAGATTASSVLFAIRPELTVTQTDIVNTGVRPVHVVRGELSLYATGLLDGSTFASVVVQLEGTGNTMQGALRSMLTHIRATDPQYTRFVQAAQQKIENYFIDITPTLLTKADALAKQQQFDNAVLILSLVPETVAGYDGIASKMANYYAQKIDLDAEKQINIAKAMLVKGEIDEALDILATVDPLSAHAPTAHKMVKGIKDDMDAKQAQAASEKAAGYERRMEQQQRDFDNKVMLEKMRLDAANKYSSQSTTATVETAKNVGQVLMSLLKK